MARVWVRASGVGATEWRFVGETTRSPTAAIAKAVYQRVEDLGPHAEVLFEQPAGTTEAAFSIGLAPSATAMSELPEAPTMTDLDT